jgi:hypothetical protein
MSESSKSRAVSAIPNSAAGQKSLEDGVTTASGVVYYDTADRTLLALALNSSKTDGLLFLGSK